MFVRILPKGRTQRPIRGMKILHRHGRAMSAKMICAGGTGRQPKLPYPSGGAVKLPNVPVTDKHAETCTCFPTWKDIGKAKHHLLICSTL